MSIKGMTMSGKGNKLTLILGLSLGLIAAVLTFVYLSSADSGGSGGSTGTGDTPVVVVTRDVPAGTRITADMIQVKNVAAGDALLGNFNTTEGVVNQIATVDLLAGEQVVTTKVTGNDLVQEQFGDNPPLSLLLQPGERGVSIEVSSLIGAGGLIRPNDRVDVILSVKTQGTTDSSGGSAGGSAGENQVAATILQNLKVVAIGQTVTTVKAGEAGSADQGTNEEATTVTLAATPIQSEILALADTCRLNFDGRLSLAVRSLGDEARFAPRSEWPSDGRTPDCASLLGITQLPTSFNFN